MSIVRRGDTDTFKFKLTTDLDLNNVTDIWLTISTQLKSKTWTYDDLTIDATNKTVSYTLTEKESLYFNPGEAEIQLSILTSSGARASTDIFKIEIGRVLNGGVMSV